jgi:hypothetical protein
MVMMGWTELRFTNYGDGMDGAPLMVASTTTIMADSMPWVGDVQPITAVIPAG